MFDKRYLDQARLLLNLLPDIAKEGVFALKGGTAINLFYRDMPRLSVDIDLTYLPIADSRKKSLKNIDKALGRIKAAIVSRNPYIRAQRMVGGGGNETRIVVSDDMVPPIKIEVSPVMRGSVFRTSVKTATEAVIEQLGPAEMNVLSFDDLYGGKICAALGRQHPRDIFDVKMLYENEGLTDDLFRVFMVYVASSNRPMHELLAPTAPFYEEDYDSQFAGMARVEVTKEEMVETRARLHADVKKRLTGDIADFLLSLHDAEPNFDLLSLPKAVDLPAIQWKIKNLKNLKRDNPKRHVEQREALEDLLA